jgi:hypothetical protein
MICKKCGVDGHFTWDTNFFENTGQWRLFDLNLERPHDCVHEQPQEASLDAAMPPPRVKCPQCDPLKDSAWIEREKFQHHIKTAHFGFW